MTVDDLKKQFICTEDVCVLKHSLVGIALAMHTIGRMMKKLSPERMEQVVARVNEEKRRIDARMLTQLLATDIDLEQMGVITIAHAIAAFQNLEDTALTHAIARSAVDGGLDPLDKCSGPIQ